MTKGTRRARLVTRVPSAAVPPGSWPSAAASQATQTALPAQHGRLLHAAAQETPRMSFPVQFAASLSWRLVLAPCSLACFPRLPAAVASASATPATSVNRRAFLILRMTACVAVVSSRRLVVASFGYHCNRLHLFSDPLQRLKRYCVRVCTMCCEVPHIFS